MSHVLNLFAFILLLIGMWLLHRTHCFAMCLWVCATFWSETIQTSNVIFGQDRKLSEKEIITKTKPEDWPKCAWNQIEDNMEPESSCNISICYDLLPVLNISRNFNFICMLDLLVTFPCNHILFFFIMSGKRTSTDVVTLIDFLQKPKP